MLIGITGTDGAGKGSAVAYLVNKKQFKHYSARDLITLEIERKGLIATRENLRLTANAMRAAEGDDMIVKCAFRQIEKDNAKDAVIESIRAIKEVETLKASGGILLAIDAPAEIRYKRIIGRGSSSDKVTFEEFIKQEELEMNDPDPNGMQKAAVMKSADYTIMNNQPLESLYHELDEFLQKFDV